MSGPTTLHRLLFEAAARWPDGEAVSYRGASVTYQELSHRVGRRARSWASRGLGRGDRVGIALPRSVEMVEAVYAASACGAAYVPLEISAPPARLETVMAAADLRAVVTTARLAGAILPPAPHPAAPTLLDMADAPADAADRLPDVTSDDAAYILFTSGSTGTPKGVVHTHASALAFALWAAGEVGLTQADRVAGHAGLHFDLSTFDLFATCSAGATLCPVPEAATLHGAHQIRFIRRERISVWYSVPLAWLRMLATPQAAELATAPLRAVIHAGEVFPLDALRRVRQVLPAARLLNFYGPTETNVCCWHEVQPSDLASTVTEAVPIGRPAAGDVLTIGRPDTGRGELFVAGPTVMYGYLGEPPLTDAYATGDEVERLADGALRFLGRVDRQLKIRGHRVEPGDVEAALSAFDGVTAVAVLGVAVAAGERELVAHVAPADTDLSGLWSHARRVLPPYMVPSRLVAHDALPRTPNGKVDLQTLGAAAGRLCYEPGR